MKKYIVLFVVVLAGIVLLSVMGPDNTAESTNKAKETKREKEVLPRTEKETADTTKSIEAVKKERTQAVQTAEKTETQKSEEQKPTQTATAKPKRKLLGGADVDWIEEQKPKKGYGKFGPPPM